MHSQFCNWVYLLRGTTPFHMRHELVKALSTGKFGFNSAIKQLTTSQLVGNVGEIVLTNKLDKVNKFKNKKINIKTKREKKIKHLWK